MLIAVPPVGGSGVGFGSNDPSGIPGPISFTSSIELVNVIILLYSSFISSIPSSPDVSSPNVLFLVSFACCTNPSSPNTPCIVIPANMINTIIVTDKAISVIPFCCFNLVLIKLIFFPLFLFISLIKTISIYCLK